MEAALQHEIKYLVAADRAPALAVLLDRLVRPDPRYPTGIVESLYFDTCDLQLLGEKLASDYLKTKVRLRWYPGTTTRPLLELKRRIGTRRHKVRLATDLEAAAVAAGAVPRLAGLPRRLRDCGLPLPEALVPVLVVRYRRRRWIEAGTGVRLALDTHVTVPRAHPALAPVRATPLAVAVFEVKGAEARLPARVAAVAVVGPRRGSFSKYAACWQHLTGGNGPDLLCPF